MKTGNDVTVVSLMNTKRSLENGYVIDDDDHYRAYLKVHSDDLDALSSADKRTWLDDFGQMLRTYTNDLKLITAATRVDTSNQQVYYRRLLIQANKILGQFQTHGTRAERYWQKRRQLASEIISRYENISRSSDDLNFYLVIFAESEKEMRNDINLLMRSGGYTFKLRLVKGKELEEMLYRISNLNEE